MDRRPVVELRDEIAELCRVATECLEGLPPRRAAVGPLLDRAEALCEELEEPPPEATRLAELRTRHRQQTQAAGRTSWLQQWWLALTFAGVAAATMWMALLASPTNLAAGATVTASSSQADPRSVVDGQAGGASFRTGNEERPHVVIDLGRPRDFDEVVIERHGDPGPLDVEISLDGELYGEYGSKRGGFERWAIDKPARARYLRIHRPRKGVLELDEVQVISR